MKKYKVDVKNQRGSATALVSITVFTFVVILMATYATVAILRQSQQESNIRIQKVYMSDVERVDEIYNEVIENSRIPAHWKKAENEENWYSYGGAKINKPKLVGDMMPIVYSKEQTGNKWANAITKDGSMFVWIPRYAYKITEGYHTNIATGGKIEIKFVDIDNKFLDGTTGVAQTDPSKITYTTDSKGNQVQNEWLVHPAFTSVASNGGGFKDSENSNKELSGLWVGKFEATGDLNAVTVKAGEATIVEKTINQMYTAGKSATFGEAVNLQSHMIKNSEWGVVSYLAHSSYGTNKQKIERQTDTSRIAGGTTNLVTIYEDENYKKHSTTYNAYGIYDLSGGAYEYTASYIYVAGNSYLTTNGGTTKNDLFGATVDEQSTSTAYKTVYKAGSSQQESYEANKNMKGDALWETSNSHFATSGAWFGNDTHFCSSSFPFFDRGGTYSDIRGGLFYFSSYTGVAYDYIGFRVCLAV